MVDRFSDSKRDEPRPGLVEVEYRIKYFRQLRSPFGRFYQSFNPLISGGIGVGRIGEIEFYWTPWPWIFAAIPKGDPLHSVWRPIVLEKAFNPLVIGGQGQVIEQAVDDALEKQQQRSSFRLPFPFAADHTDDRLCRDVVGHQAFGQRNLTSGAPGKIAGAEGRVGSQLHACFPPIHAQEPFDYIQRRAASTLARITNTVKGPILATNKIYDLDGISLWEVSRCTSLGEPARVGQLSRKGHVGH